MRIERFAPSPTGLLHLGHAFSAAMGWMGARRFGGQFLLRIEDLDASRCRPEFYDAIKTDLSWLGLQWDGDVLCQSRRRDAYDAALNRLDDLGLTYPCTCTRKDMMAAINAPQEGATSGVPLVVYPGTCRNRAVARDASAAIRLNMAAAIEYLGGADAIAKLAFQTTNRSGELGQTQLRAVDLLKTAGDIVLKRKDGAAAYHLAVIVDDAFQNVTHVTRGEDLAEATQIHRLLQALLNVPTPTYFHHPLIRDESGKRLAKRDDARSIQALRTQGVTRTEIFHMIGLSDPAAEFAS